LLKALFAAALAVCLPSGADARSYAQQVVSDTRLDSDSDSVTAADPEALDEASIEASARKLQEMREALREKKRRLRRYSGAPNGWGVTMGVNLFSAFDYTSVLGSGIFPTLGLEKSLSDRFSLKGTYAWNGTDLHGSSGTLWTADLQIRNYPIDQGKLRGLFLGPSVQYVESIYYTTLYHYYGYPSYASYTEYFHDYSNAWGVGPVIGYQWVFGSTVLLNLENSYRYYWVNLPKAYTNYYSSSYYGGTQSQANSSAWDFKATVGWAF
jgi:hypothetical protein